MQINIEYLHIRIVKTIVWSNSRMFVTFFFVQLYFHPFHVNSLNNQIKITILECVLFSSAFESCENL